MKSWKEIRNANQIRRERKDKMPEDNKPNGVATNAAPPSHLKQYLIIYDTRTMNINIQGTLDDAVLFAAIVDKAKPIVENYIREQGQRLIAEEAVAAAATASQPAPEPPKENV